MVNKNYQWIWEYPKWPAFEWDENTLRPYLNAIYLHQGVLLGQASCIEETASKEKTLDILLQNIISSSAIEGETLNAESVRSSLAKRMHVPVREKHPTSKQSEGIAKLMLDAIQDIEKPMTEARLFKWHQWLFSDTLSTVHPIQVGELRTEDVMQVISGRFDKPKIHFEAPHKKQLKRDLKAFIQWFNQSRDNIGLDPLLRAGICHLWFVTLHPFDDGNGRITRVLTDLTLAQAEKQSIRLYTMASTILKKRISYYEILERTQRGSLNITEWLVWFLESLNESLLEAIDTIKLTLDKAKFWQRHQNTELAPEQRRVLNRLLDGGEKGFGQGIKANQYQQVAKVSKATATRHLSDLLKKGCLEKFPGGGRSTRYHIKGYESSILNNKKT